MATRGAGVSGSAVLIAAAGVYLVYAGIKDVPLVDGLRELLRARDPGGLSRSGSGYAGPELRDAGRAVGGLVTGATTLPGNDDCIRSGASSLSIQRLVGNARNAYCTFKAMFPSMVIHGWGLRDNPSDHPIGKALDLMTTDNATAQRIIATFRMQTGAKYWIWNRQIASADRGWLPRPYTGRSPHTDHVHLSYT